MLPRFLLHVSVPLGLVAGPIAAQAVDHEAGVPLQPKEAAGAWTLTSAGRPICVVRLSERPSASGYAVRADRDCAGALPAAPLVWRPTRDGMALAGPGGELSFARWSNSLFVSHRASGEDVQLRRGPPGPPPS